ncbi:MAG: trigger factor [Candidatus Izimaplasma sp.]|nr:trigger factor [Candidatus Izimaplasma bacterium]
MVKVDKLSGSKVRIEIEVSKELFEQGLEHSFNQVKDDVEVKGFRKGKVSRTIFEKHFGVESLYEEAINHCIQESYIDAVTTEKVTVVAQPKIDVDITKVEKGKGFKYVAEVAVEPVVTLGDYKDLEFENLSDEVKDEQVDVEINKLLEQNAELVLKEEGSLENGDTAIFDFEGSVDGVLFEGGKAENYELLIGSGQFIPGFEDKMLGMKLDEERNIEIKFPEDYQAENLKGKDAVFKIKLHEMKRKEIPELNDDFIKELDKKDINTVDELKADILTKLKDQLILKNNNARIDFAVNKAVENATYEIAQEMIEEEKNRLVDNVVQQAKQYNLDLDTYLQYSGISKEDFDKNLLKDAEKSIATRIVVQAISKEEKIEATQEEKDAKYEEIAAQYKMDINQVKVAVNDEAVASEVEYKKTLDFLVDSLKIIK